MVMGVEKAAFFLKGMFLPKRLVTPWRGENWRGLCQQLRPPGCWQGRVVGGLPAVHGLAPARSWLAAPLSSCEAAVEAKCGRGGWHARQDMGASWPPWRLLQAEGGMSTACTWVMGWGVDWKPMARKSWCVVETDSMRLGRGRISSSVSLLQSEQTPHPSALGSLPPQVPSSGA